MVTSPQAMSFDLWVKIIGACTATFTFLGVLWKPCKAWCVLRWDTAVESSFTRNPKTYNRIMREEVMAREIAIVEHTAEVASANEDRLQMAEASLIAQGAALLEIPKISAKMEGLPAAIDRFSDAMAHMAENVSHIKGKMDERERREAIEASARAWDGYERRSVPRMPENGNGAAYAAPPPPAPVPTAPPELTQIELLDHPDKENPNA